MTLDIDFVRSQFPALDNEWAFMDNAGGTQILKGCVDKINEYYYSNNVQLDVSKFHSGIYFVKVQSKNHLYTKKVQIIK